MLATKAVLPSLSEAVVPLNSRSRNSQAGKGLLPFRLPIRIWLATLRIGAGLDWPYVLMLCFILPQLDDDWLVVTQWWVFSVVAPVMKHETPD